MKGVREKSLVVIMKTYSVFGERLTQLLAERGLSQKEFAEQTGLTEAAVSRYVSGNREPRLKGLLVMADFFGVSLDALVGKVPTDSHIPVQEMCRRVRQKKGWTQYHLAIAIGTTQTEVSFIENGFIPPDISKVEHLCELYRGCCR